MKSEMQWQSWRLAGVWRKATAINGVGVASQAKAAYAMPACGIAGLKASSA